MDDGFEAFVKKWHRLGQKAGLDRRNLAWVAGEWEQGVLLGLWNAYREGPDVGAGVVRNCVRRRLWWDALASGLIVDHRNGQMAWRTRDKPILDAPLPDDDGEDEERTLGSLLIDPRDHITAAEDRHLIAQLEDRLSALPGRARNPVGAVGNFIAVCRAVVLFGYSRKEVSALLGVSDSLLERQSMRARLQLQALVSGG